MSSLYEACLLCPRACGTNRQAGSRGSCGETAELRIAVASIHHGEEPPVVASGGSGTLFVTGCALRCAFCQNHQISQSGMGAPVDSELFARICLALEERGAENINVVTGSHAVPALMEGLRVARTAGLSIPALWNSSAYETVQAVDLASQEVSVWLPDLKTLDSDLAGTFFQAPDYPEAAKAAILRMAELAPLSYAPSRSDASVQAIRSGLIVRHLVLPGRLESSRQVLRWFAENIGERGLISVMTQYTPVQAPAGRQGIPSTGYLQEDEYQQLLAMIDEFGLEDGFYQELVVGSDWLPDFQRVNPFSSDLSVPVWHWKHGFVS